MRKGNSESNVEFVRRIEQARDLLDEALALMKDGLHPVWMTRG
jgi:hypothetical protein